MALTVFISHAAPDADVARALQGWIEEIFIGGIRVFASSDGKSISPGEDWRGVVEENLRQAGVVLVVCTGSSLSRPWVGFEAGAGWMNGAKVVPLCYHEVEVEKLPLPFSARQGLDLGDDQHLARLLALLAREGQFDLTRIQHKPLALPDRRSRSATGPDTPDVRVTANFGRIGTPGQAMGDLLEGESGAPALFFRAENHDRVTVYLEAGVEARRRGEPGRKLMFREIQGRPLFAVELHPGRATTIPIVLDRQTATIRSLREIERVYFVDQIGRRYYAPDEQLAHAVQEFEQWATSDRR